MGSAYAAYQQLEAADRHEKEAEFDEASREYIDAREGFLMAASKRAISGDAGDTVRANTIGNTLIMSACDTA